MDVRPIDANALFVKGIPCYYGDSCHANDVREWIDEAPTLDYAPVRHASWIRQDDTYTRFQCGECKSKNFDRRWVFCPLCGAKMDGGKS